MHRHAEHTGSKKARRQEGKAGQNARVHERRRKRLKQVVLFKVVEVLWSFATAHVLKHHIKVVCGVVL